MFKPFTYLKQYIMLFITRSVVCYFQALCRVCWTNVLVSYPPRYLTLSWGGYDSCCNATHICPAPASYAYSWSPPSRCDVGCLNPQAAPCVPWGLLRLHLSAMWHAASEGIKTTHRLLRTRTKTRGARKTSTQEEKTIIRRPGFKRHRTDRRVQRDESFLSFSSTSFEEYFCTRRMRTSTLTWKANFWEKMAHIHLRSLLVLALVHVVSWLLWMLNKQMTHSKGVLRAAFLTCVSFLLVFLPLQVLSSGVFELKINSFHTAQRICRRHRDCHIFFRICLKHPEDVISAEPPCTFGTGHTNVIRADHTSISSSAPIRVPFHFKWPVNRSHWVEENV